MTELERRALLGDQEAQKECTEQGIVLPCPLCGKQPGPIRHVSNNPILKPYAVCCGGENCRSYVMGDTPEEAIQNWNARPAPPIGRCGTCKWFAENNNGEWYGCKLFNAILAVPEDAPQSDDYCSYYELREEEQ